MDDLAGHHMESERRVNSLVTEVAIQRETVKNLQETAKNSKESFDKLERGQIVITAELSKVVASNDRMEVTLKYIVDAQINSALTPLKNELAVLKEESVIRKAQIAIWTMLGSGAGVVLMSAIGFLFKWWGTNG